MNLHYNYDYITWNNHQLLKSILNQIMVYIQYLDLKEDTICFFLHDDLILKSFDFIPLCIDALKTHMVIGNCMNYPDNAYDPNKIIEIGIKEEFDNKSRIEYVMPENKSVNINTMMDFKFAEFLYSNKISL